MDIIDEIKSNIKSGEEQNLQGGGLQALLQSLSKQMAISSFSLIIFGSLMCVTIIGIIPGALLIKAAFHLGRTSEEFSFFKSTINSTNLVRAFDTQQKFFNIFKIGIISAIVLILVIIASLFIFQSSIEKFLFRS